MRDSALSKTLLRAIIQLASLPAADQCHWKKPDRETEQPIMAARELHRALMLLASLPPDGGTVRDAELAWALGMSRSTVTRLMKTLAFLGLAQQTKASNFYELPLG
jgi:biotin operon repressor